MKLNLKKIDKGWVLSSSRHYSISDDWFDVSYWNQISQCMPHNMGKRSTWFINRSHDSMVLRRYYRGGFLSYFNKKYYIRFTLKASRVYRELSLLIKLNQLNLPCPQPIGGRIIYSKMFYTADLLMHEIRDSKNLVELLTLNALTESAWNNIGITIANFHNNGVFHADLNSHNILIDINDKVWLVDFDKGKQIKPYPAWQLQNLARLKRSLLKEHYKAGIIFEIKNWYALMDGYQSNIYLPTLRAMYN